MSLRDSTTINSWQMINQQTFVKQFFAKANNVLSLSINVSILTATLFILVFTIRFSKQIYQLVENKSVFKKYATL